jgi:hypothetical protein
VWQQQKERLQIGFAGTERLRFSITYGRRGNRDGMRVVSEDGDEKQDFGANHKLSLLIKTYHAQGN